MQLKIVCLIIALSFSVIHYADDIDLYTTEAMLAAVAIPVSANPQARFKNQVYIGLFKPRDAGRWQGNLKLYQIGIDKTGENQMLLDADGKPALDRNGVSFAPNSRSFWTNGSDNPDGGAVVLGGVAQSLRQYVGDNRLNLTCTSECTRLDPMTATNPNLRPADFGVSDNAEMAQLLAWSKEGHGDVVHSQPAIIDYGAQKGLYAFYGSNDGMFHAVKVGTAEKTVKANAKDGEEQWTFTAPQHFRRLGQLFHSQLHQQLNKKFYFFDGPVSSFVEADDEGEIRTAIIIITARRGGRLMLAMDVTEPQSPILLWQKSNLDKGFAELGQTWSKPVIKPIKLAKGKVVNALFMGLGYDPDADDLDASRSQGRGLVVLDVLTGKIIWQRADLPFSVPADISVLDLNQDGFADRLYFGDSGGQLWRAEIADSLTSSWQLQLLFKLPDGRKFLNAPDIVASPDGTYNAIIIGSGDREKPLQADTQDYLVSYRDFCIKPDHKACNTPAVNLHDLQKVAINKYNASTKKIFKGWFLPLEMGEKIVTRAVTLNSKTSIASHKPCAEESCDPLGEARIYSFDPFIFAEDQGLASKRYYRSIQGVGILPPPVPFAIEMPTCIDDECPEVQSPIGGVAFGPYIQPSTSAQLGKPIKLWWYRQ